MSRFYLPSVDRLEDRCVPAVDLLVTPIEVVPPPEPTPIEVVVDLSVEVVVPSDVVVIETTADTTVDYDASIDLAPVVAETPIDDALLDTSDPFVDDYTSIDVGPIVEDAIDEATLDASDSVDPFFVIDPPLIDPSAPVQPTPEPSDTDAAPVPFDLLPLLPPIAPPFWF